FFPTTAGAYQLSKAGVSEDPRSYDAFVAKLDVSDVVPTTPVDTQPPTITIISPADGATFTLNQAVPANYSCTDPSGVSSCTGPVANGSAINTSTVGAKAFTVGSSPHRFLGSLCPVRT